MPKHQRESRKNRKGATPYESGEIAEDRKDRHGKGGSKRSKSKGRKGGSGGGGAWSSIHAPCTTFDEMNLKPDLLKGIYAYGFEKPSAIQQRAIKPIVLGRDVIAQSQSGTGKTAVFSIASLQLLDQSSREVQVMVLSPTRELAEQSQKVMQSLGDFMNVRKHTLIFWNNCDTM
jgi:Lhr-like helicase